MIRRTSNRGARRAILAAGLALACHSGLNLTTEQLDAIHQHCTARIRQGYTFTESPTLAGRIARKSAGTPVIVYGAAWCDPCHVATAYLRRRGIPYVEHDIEKDVVAKATMDAKLNAVGIRSSDSLPVIDVRGTIMTAFMPCAIDAAWDET